jgi:RHS repeat-associated protein
MLTAAKEGTFSASSDPCVFFPLAASEGVPKNSRLGFARKNPAPHQGSAWSNSGKALGIEEVVWENCGRSDDSARYYDSSAGRFFSEDPIRFRGGTNLYTYVQNRPDILRDPSGRIAWGGGIVGSAAGGVFWAGGGGEGAFYFVGDSRGNQGILSCSGFGIGAVAGASASVQAGSVVCPNCKSICDMPGAFGGVQAFGGVGANGAAGGGVSLSNTSATIFTSAGVGVGVGGGLVAVGGSCTLIWKHDNCPSCPAATQ